MARTKVDEKRNREAQIAKFQGTSEKPPAPPEGEPKKQRKKRRKNRKAWASEVKRFQGPTPAQKFVPKQPFKRLVREVLAEARPGQDYRITKKAMQSLHEVSMAEIGEMMAMANDCVVHRKGHTLRLNDIKLIRKLVGKMERRFSVAASA